jgi:ribonuclease HIII
VTGDREIDYATKYQVSNGSERAELNVYSTGKVSVGGKDSGLKRRLEAWRTANSKELSRMDGKSKSKPRVASSAKPVASSTPRVGTDEAGKGDYFGPLVVAGVRVLGGDQDRSLREAGVRDSKELSLSQALSISARIKEIVGAGNFYVIALEPREYDRRRNAVGSNVGRLLGEVNVEIITKLKDEVEVAVIDEFGTKARSYIEGHIPEGVRLEVRPRAEDDTAVAAASILARARYLEAMTLLSEEAGLDLPRGSTHVEDAAVRGAREFGEEWLQKVAKTHFSTTKRVLERVRGESR